VDGHPFRAVTTSDGLFRGEITESLRGESVLLRVSHNEFSTVTRWITLTSDMLDTLAVSMSPIEP
jgi:hypothetical protein